MTSLVAYAWSFSVIRENQHALLEGLKTTVIISALSMAFALAIGGFLALVAELGGRVLRGIVVVYTEIFRSLPLLVVLLWAFWVLPIALNVSLSPNVTAISALSLAVGAYVCEAFRAGIASISSGQRQAGQALGLNALQVARLVLWPQAWRRTLPIVGSIWVGLFKDSSLVSLIEVHDLMFDGREIANESYRYLEVFTTVALIYFVVAYPQARLVDALYNRFRTAE